MSLVREIRVGECLVIGNTVIELLEKSGKVARIAIDAPPETKVEQRKDANSKNMKVLGNER